MEKYFCGPAGSSQYVKKNLSKVFNEACRQHDSDYSDLNVSKEDADRRFYDNMKKRAGFWPIKRLLAWIYYKSVKSHGGKFWRTAQLESRQSNEV